MDRFKFRVWVNGTMCDPFSFEDIYNAAFAELKPSQVFEKYTFMQCTGLKDKNGRLIFEGDIVSQSDSVYEIMFEQGDFQTGWKKKAGKNLTDLGREFMGKFEIIGNIYENPELLEEGK